MLCRRHRGEARRIFGNGVIADMSGMKGSVIRLNETLGFGGVHGAV